MVTQYGEPGQSGVPQPCFSMQAASGSAHTVFKAAEAPSLCAFSNNSIKCQRVT